VLRIDPENVLAKNNLGNIALARGEYERAMRLLEEAITTRPAYFEAHLNLGNVHLALGHYEEAEAQYRNALEIDAGSTPAEYNLAKCYEKSRRWDAAARTFENLVAREPHNARFLNDLGCAYLAVGRLMDAEQKLRTAISTQPGWAVPYHNLGLVLDAQGRYEESIAAKEKAAALGLPAPTSGP
jgi:protein O-GlcNAc transferase